MAFSACSPRLAAPGGRVLPSPASPRGRPSAIAAAVAIPRLSAVALIRRSWGDRGVRAMAVVKKYKGTRMREKRLAQMIEEKVREAGEGDARSDECRVAWDEVEEVSRAKADLRRRLAGGDQDPLESFCQENPDTDECRAYDED